MWLASNVWGRLLWKSKPEALGFYGSDFVQGLLGYKLKQPHPCRGKVKVFRLKLLNWVNSWSRWRGWRDFAANLSPKLRLRRKCHLPRLSRRSQWRQPRKALTNTNREGQQKPALQTVNLKRPLCVKTARRAARGARSSCRAAGATRPPTGGTRSGRAAKGELGPLLPNPQRMGPELTRTRAGRQAPWDKALPRARAHVRRSRRGSERQNYSYRGEAVKMDLGKTVWQGSRGSQHLPKDVILCCREYVCAK